jgi:1,4-alpha-glucan branching enzyme
MVDNADQSVFAFERHVGDSDLLFVFNMTPNYYEYYDVGVNNEGEWYELFNSDKDVYGGKNQYNGLNAKSYPGGPENRPYHVTIKLGSYAALILKRIVEKPKATKKKGSKKHV